MFTEALASPPGAARCLVAALDWLGAHEDRRGRGRGDPMPDSQGEGPRDPGLGPFPVPLT